MRRRVILPLLFMVLLLSNCFVAFAGDGANYKAKYKHQLYVNRGMAATAIMMLTWFKNHPEYKKFDSIKSRVDGFYKDLEKAKEAHFKALALAKKEEWKAAYESLKKEWNYLNDIAVKGKKTQDDLMELEKKQVGGADEK